MNVEFDVSQVDQLIDDLDDAGPRVEERAKTVVSKTGHDSVASMQQLAAVDTGAMKNSTGVDIDSDGLGFEAGPTVEYAPFVEWGTTKMAPQPFVVPGFEQNLPAAYEAFEQVAGGIFP